MGKGQRARLARADEMKEKKIAAKKKAKKDKVVRVISIITTIVLVIGLVGWLGYSVVDSANRSNGTYLKKDIALESANFKITNAQMMYYFQNYYSNFVNSNADYLSAIGLDTSKSLKDQTYPSTGEDGSSMSWYEYFMNESAAQVQSTLVLAEAAKASGMELSEDEVKEIETSVAQIEPANYAPGLTREDIQGFMEIATLASNYQTKVQDDVEYTDADIEKYYTDNKNNYDTVDFYMYSFSYAASEEGETALTKEAAKKLADELAATGNEAAYVAWLTNYFTNTLKVKDVATELAAYKNENFGYTDGYAGIDFLFGSEGKVGAIKVIDDETDEAYKVYLVLRAAGRDETLTASVRHILISVEDSADAAAKAEAKKKADGLLVTWKENGGTEDAFAALVHDNTTDPGSKETGGLYENFGKGEMVKAFEDWSFDPARKKGDTGVVETEYGYHVMYYVGQGEATWKTKAQADYVSAEYSKQYEGFVEKYVVTMHQDKIGKIASYIN